MHGCMDADSTLQPTKAQAGHWYLDRNFALQLENDTFAILGANSGPSDQNGPPGHLATTCVHHHIGNEPTGAVT